MLPGIIPVCSRIAPLATFLGILSDATDLTTYNIGSIVMPRAGLMVVGVASRLPTGARNLSSATIGGSAATINASTPSGANVAALVSRRVAAGSQAISVTFNGSVSRCWVGAWMLEGLWSDTPVGTDAQSTATMGAAVSVAANIAAGGLALFACAAANTGGSTPDVVSFSSALSRSDTVLETAMRAAFADKAVKGPGLTPHTEVVSSATTDRNYVAMATWR